MIMKYLKFFTSILLLCLVMTACTKEGQYAPKKKISKVTFTETLKMEEWTGSGWGNAWVDTVSSFLVQQWNWRGKRLESIDYFNSNNQPEYTHSFTYDGKRISAISYGSYRYEFVYDNDVLTAIEYYYGSEHTATCAIRHERGKITKLTFTELSSKAAQMAPLPLCGLSLPFPTQHFQALKQMGNTKGSDDCEYTFEWDGDNVSHLVFTSQNRNIEYYFTYDNKLNPLYGLWDDQATQNDMVAEGFYTTLSKNNITRCECLEGGERYHYDYTYVYSGKYPTSITCTFQLEQANVSRTAYSYTHTYEYR